MACIILIWKTKVYRTKRFLFIIDDDGFWESYAMHELLDSSKFSEGLKIFQIARAQ